MTSYRITGTMAQLIVLLRVPIIVTIASTLILLDVVFAGSIREAARYALLDAPEQLLAIVLLFCALAFTLRLTGDAMVDQFGRDLLLQAGPAAFLTRYAPALCVIAIGASAGLPFLRLGLEPHFLVIEDTRKLSLAVGASLVCIGLLMSVLRIPRLTGWPEQSQSMFSPLVALPLALLPLGIVLVFSNGLMGLFPLQAGQVAHPNGAPAAAIAAFALALSLRTAMYTLLEHDGGAGRLNGHPGASAALSSLSSLIVGCVIAYEFYGASPQMVAAVVTSSVVASGLPSMIVWRRLDQTSRAIQAFAFNWNTGIQQLATINAPWTRNFGLVLLLSVAATAVVAMATTSDWGGVISASLGPIGIVLLWGACSLAIFFPIAFQAHVAKLPLLTLLFACAVAFSALDLNDNHGVRLVKRSSKAPPDHGAQTFIRTWLGTRDDLDEYDRYPIYIVATEGGGIRSAYFASSVLAAIQDLCPVFSKHIIAISGVSGGSVGATVFAASAANHSVSRNRCVQGSDDQTPDFWYTGLARATLSDDMLSPALAAMLFPDAIQRLLPYPVPSFDRAVAIELELERSWERAAPWQVEQKVCESTGKQLGSCTMSEPFGSLFTKAEVPNLLLNATEVSTGYLATVSSIENPIGDVEDTGRILRNLETKGVLDSLYSPKANPTQPTRGELVRTIDFYLNDDDELPLSTAAILSARFPYLSPAARIQISDSEHKRFVDGGYFENSGTWMASTFARTLQMQLQGTSAQGLQKKVELHVLVISSALSCSSDRPSESGSDDRAIVTSDTAHELLSPIRALLNTRDARAAYSRLDLSLLSQGATADAPLKVSQLCFENVSDESIPLTWVLSIHARESIDFAINGMIVRIQQILHGRPMNSPNRQGIFEPTVLPLSNEIRLGKNNLAKKVIDDVVGGNIKDIICSLLGKSDLEALPDHGLSCGIAAQKATGSTERRS